MNKPNLSISFSGGRSSAVMSYICTNTPYRDLWGDIIVTFANTGKERPETLDFVKACDENWGLNVVWLEAVPHYDSRKSCTHKIVNYETASRNGEAFESVVKKYGIPNQVFKLCTRELKLNPMKSYLKSKGWVKGKKANHYTAIGIRADELDRISDNAEKDKLIYPLVDLNWTKEKVNSFMSQFDWDLKLPHDGFGNCDFCFKKSTRKLLTNIIQDPEGAKWWADLANKYEGVGAGCSKENPRKMYRGKKTMEELIEMAESVDFEPYQDKTTIPWEEYLDLGGDCDQGCEVY